LWASGFVHSSNNYKLCTNSYPNYPWAIIAKCAILLAGLRNVHMFGHNLIYTFSLDKSFHPKIYFEYIVECGLEFQV